MVIMMVTMSATTTVKMMMVRTLRLMPMTSLR